MQKIRVICVGRLKEKHYADACAEYIKRLGRYCALEITEVPETGDLEREGDEILSRIPAGAWVSALCVEGILRSSEELAETLRSRAGDGTNRVCFLIGGSDGLSPRVKERADERISMSRMVFPHHLARVMLLEQVYRAYTIINGGKYHK